MSVPVFRKIMISIMTDILKTPSSRTESKKNPAGWWESQREDLVRLDDEQQDQSLDCHRVRVQVVEVSCAGAEAGEHTVHHRIANTLVLLSFPFLPFPSLSFPLLSFFFLLKKPVWETKNTFGPKICWQTLKSPGTPIPIRRGLNPAQHTLTKSVRPKLHKKPIFAP